VFVFYQLARYRYPTARWLPLLGAAMLLLSPRFFAEAFYNGKDIAFMVTFSLAILTLVRLTQRPTWQRTLGHALATALAADVRLAGLVLLPALTAVALLAQTWALPKRTRPFIVTSWASRLLLFGLYIVSAVLATIVGWPYLWAAPVSRIYEVLSAMGHFPWPGMVLYLGKLVPATELPWHYLLVWIGITTPLPYLGLAFLGVFTGVYRLIQRGVVALRQSGGWLDVLFAAWLLGPLLLIILNKSLVYDGWRHVYFVYPALLLLALRGLRTLGRAWQMTSLHTSSNRRKRWLAGAVLVLLSLETGRTAWFIMRAYPNQQVYFSFLPSATAERLFERDYWGASYRYGLEWLLRHDSAPILKVTGPQQSIIYVNWAILTPEQQRRIQIVSSDSRQARYYLTAYRWHPQPYADSLGPEVLAYRPGGGIKALSIFRRDSLKWPLPSIPIGVGHRP
jgi:hypothetical protein